MYTIIYEYGARLDEDSERLADVQFYLARSLYNDCISIIKKAREDAESYVRQCEPDIADKQAELDRLEDQFKQAKADNNELMMKSVKAEKKQVWAELKPMLKDARKKHKEKLTLFYSVIGLKKECLTYQARCDYVAQGLGSTTADDIHATALKAWDKVRKEGGQLSYRSGKLRQQDHIINRFTCAGGVLVKDLLNSNNKMINISTPAKAGNRQYGDFSFRLGSAKANQYANGSWQYHREFQEGAKVTTIRLIRKRIASKINWALQFQLAIPALPVIDVEPKYDLAAVHLGFSLDDSGYRQIGAITHHADSSFAEIIELDDRIPKELHRVTQLQSDLDTLRDNLHAGVIKSITPAFDWEDDIKEEWLALKKLQATYVSVDRIKNLFYLMQNQEWNICSMLKQQVFDAFASFCKSQHFCHLEGRHLHKKTLNYRKLFYRRLALKLVHNYKTIVVSRFDLKDMALRIKEDGDRNELGQLARSARHGAALYEFLQVLHWAATRAGAVIIEETQIDYTKTCSACGSEISKVDDFISCECGHTDNHKANAAVNLFVKWQDIAADKAAEIRQEQHDKQQAAQDKKAEKISRMVAKRKLASEKEESESSVDIAA